MESGIQPQESGILLTIGIRNPSSTDNDWKPIPGFYYVGRRILLDVLLEKLKKFSEVSNTINE